MSFLKKCIEETWYANTLISFSKNKELTRLKKICNCMLKANVPNLQPMSQTCHATCSRYGNMLCICFGYCLLKLNENGLLLYNANNLHEKNRIYTLLCLTWVSVDQPDGYSTLFFWQSCHFPNVWIHTMYKFDNTQFILQLSTILLCKRSISSVLAWLNRINQVDYFDHGIILTNWQIANIQNFVKKNQ